MSGLLFGYDDLTATPVGCDEYDRMWAELNGRPRGGEASGRLAVHSSYTDEDEKLTAWGFRGQTLPALGERVRTGHSCQHWLFHPEAQTAPVDNTGDGDRWEDPRDTVGGQE